jgi:hypothetical protein
MQSTAKVIMVESLWGVVGVVGEPECTKTKARAK